MSKAISLARTVIDKYGADADKPSVHLARALIDGAHERDSLRSFISDIADDGCAYNDNCPSNARHYVCLPCKAKRELARVGSK
jgi:hypothetical protein